MTSSTVALQAVRGVIFDFHSTLIDAGDPGSWMDAAWRRLGRPADPATTLGVAASERIRDFLDRIWEHAHTIDPDSERDVSAARHREVFARTVGLLPEIDPEFGAALYAAMMGQWVAYDDAVPVLAELRRRGLRIVVLSNIGIDIRDCLRREGLADLLDGVVLSFEVGAVKPAPEIFLRALELLEVPASQALMVGDSWRADAGAAAVGIPTLLLPPTVGPVHGLEAVLRLVGEMTRQEAL